MRGAVQAPAAADGWLRGAVPVILVPSREEPDMSELPDGLTAADPGAPGAPDTSTERAAQVAPPTGHDTGRQEPPAEPDRATGDVDSDQHDVG